MADVDLYTRTNPDGTVYHFRDDRIEYKTYSSVTDLGLTSGSATIADTWSALPNDSILICPAENFLIGAGGVPVTYGTVEMVRYGASRGWIYFHGKSFDHGDYRMFLTGSNVPTGTWEGQMTGSLGKMAYVILAPNQSVNVGFTPKIAIIDWYNSGGTFKTQIIPVSGTTIWSSGLQQIGTFSWSGTTVTQNTAYYVSAIVFGE